MKIRRLGVAAALAVATAGSAGGAIAARGSTPENHTLPACTNGATIWADYRADTYTDDGGHTYGPATTLTCNPDGDNTLNIRYLPSTMTLAEAHTYCTDAGAAYFTTRHLSNANVCPDVDF